MGRVSKGQSAGGKNQPDSSETPDFAILNHPLEELISLPDETAAEALQMRMMAWDAIDDLKELSFIDRGRISQAFEARQLWRHCGFTCFEAWMCSGRGGSRTTKYAALKAVNHLVNVPSGMLEKIPRCNVEILVGVSSATREMPEVLEAATGSAEAFTAYLAANHPLQHIEARKRIKFMVGLSGIERIDQAISMAIEDGLAGTRDEALVKVAEIAIEIWTTDRMLARDESFQKALEAVVPLQRVM